MLPERFKLAVLPKTRKQFQVLKKLMNSRDVSEIVCATDAGREGELIFRRVYTLCGCKKPIKRLWISSMTDEAIKAGFRNLRDGQKYRNLALSAYARAEADWIVGMNFSRLFSIKCNDRLSIGRVQTPVLAMLVGRLREIEGFKPTPYWQLESKFESFSALWFCQQGERIIDKKRAEEIYQKCNNANSAIVVNVQKNRAKKIRLYYSI
jgi:DNA topoisomerase-3